MLLMPASCHLARRCCRLYHNTKATNFTMKIFLIRFTVVDMIWCKDF